MSTLNNHKKSYYNVSSSYYHHNSFIGNFNFQNTDTMFTLNFLGTFLGKIKLFDESYNAIYQNNEKQKNELNKKFHGISESHFKKQKNSMGDFIYQKDDALKRYEYALTNIDLTSGNVQQLRDALWLDYKKECEEILIARNKQVEVDKKERSEFEKSQRDEYEKNINAIDLEMNKKLNYEIQTFTDLFCPESILRKITQIRLAEPDLENYKCVSLDSNPDGVHAADICFKMNNLHLSTYSKSFLSKYYPDLYRNDNLHFPFNLSFDDSFNYLFEVDCYSREIIVEQARTIAMRLFMMLPPNKVYFTFIDPITLGKSFNVFGQLVDVNDKTSKVINGKIWSSVDDIDERLRVLEDHISNVTQRCLQGKYKNIRTYNEDAEQNAEPYQVLMISDFPGGFQEKSLQRLEKIISTGADCGVFTILIKNSEQISQKDNDKLLPLIDNISKKAQRFTVKNNKVVFADVNLYGEDVILDIKHLTDSDMNKVIPVLKEGIRKAESPEIKFIDFIKKEIQKDRWFEGSSLDDLQIPIGNYGANKTQYLSFGDKYSIHALIVGQTGSGKTTLLHTIIMSSLIKYSADELQIYMIDFKRGVEFKIYANYKLDTFSAIAIESEREFGASVIEHLDKEINRRKEKFNRYTLDHISEYRTKSGEKMPRILLIIDEFHKLFPKESDALSPIINQKFEHIIKEGRCFGIHVVLASQSLVGVGNISNDVWNQVSTRIALKCPKEDARLVLGDGNDGVDLLSQNSPGQAVFNSDCGNVIANTIFRIFNIDRDDQNILLEDIQRTRNVDNPKTRILLSNVEDNINNPFHRYKETGINAFVDDEFENSVLIGETLNLFGKLKTTFMGDKKSNMLIIGQDANKARTVFAFSCLSLILGCVKKYDIKVIEENLPIIQILDFMPPEDEEDKRNDALNVLCECLQNTGLINYAEFVPFKKPNIVDKPMEALQKVYTDLENRVENHENECKFFMVFGLQRADDLKSNNFYNQKPDKSSYNGIGFNVPGMANTDNKTIKEMFLNIIANGAEKRIHSIIWEADFKNFSRYYAEQLELFRMRIGFTMPDDDSGYFMNESYGSKLSENNAILSYYGNEKFRPYKKPDIDWLKAVCGRIINDVNPRQKGS